MKDYQTIDYAVSEQILTVTLNRPEKLNAFTTLMCEELVDAFQSASTDGSIGAVIVTGAGRAFCAGMDLSVDGNVFGLSAADEPSFEEIRQGFAAPDIVNGIRDTGGRVALAIFACLKPVIGAINGVAVGVGSTMTLPMDFRLASRDARFGFVFGRLGIVPEACSSWFLPRLVGISKSLEWSYRADIVPVEEASAAGLVQSVHAPDDLIPAARAFAKTLVAGRSQAAIALTRQMMWRNSALDHPEEAHVVESLAVLATSRSDGAEGVRAFREKRPPHFSAGPESLPTHIRGWLDGSSPTT